jgi:hypothetical protein
MRNSPRIASFIRKQFGAGHVKDLPAGEPGGSICLAIRILQVWPDLLLASSHLCQPVFTCPGVMSAVDPPLVSKRQVSLKVQQQIRRGHGTTRKEMGGHPTALEIIGSTPMSEDMDEQFTTGFQSSSNLLHEQLVVFHVLEQLDRYHSIERLRLELILNHISGNYLKIGKSFGSRA